LGGYDAGVETMSSNTTSMYFLSYN